MLAGLACSLLAAAAAAQPASPAAHPRPRKLAIANKVWTGDFDKLLERRMLRVFAPFSRSLYFNDRGRERGLAVELVRDWERYLNLKYARQLGKRPLTIYVAPATRDKLLPDLAAGLTDVSIGNLTVTGERQEIVDFVSGVYGRRTVDELVVTGPRSPELRSLDDLSGQRVHVRKASSYYESLVDLNQRLRREQKEPATLVLVPDSLEDEDLMEMLDAGLVELLVVDDWKARMWAQVLPKIKVRSDLALRQDARTGWAIRKDSPRLAAEIEDFFQHRVLKEGVQEYRLRLYMKRVKELKDPTASAEYKRFQATLALFEKYGGRYHFDPLMLAAQGYQESGLNQQARSQVGAVGIMQIMPATGAEMKVGDIHLAEPNVHAGAKYMDQLMSRFFPDARFSEGNRPLFAFASYNCGPGNVARARREAARRGLDPDRWFNNVEIVVARQIGMETTTYVRNIYKYYVAYRLTLDAQAEAAKARQALAAPGLAPALVLEGVTVLDLASGLAEPGLTVVVAGDRIAEVGKTLAVARPAGARVVDGNGKFLIPGLWDMHVHTAFGDWFPGARDIALPLFVANGVTGVRDMGGDLDVLLEWRQAIGRGALVGPRMVISGPMLDGPQPRFPSSLAIASAEDGRRAVRDLAARGVDFIKLQSLVPRDAAFAIAEEARKVGIPFAGHVPDAVRASEMAAAGQHSFEHLIGIFEGSSPREDEFLKGDKSPGRFLQSFDQARAGALAAELARHRTWQCPTLAWEQGGGLLEERDLDHDPLAKYAPASWRNGAWKRFREQITGEFNVDDLATRKRFLAKELEVVGALHRAGVPFLAGTDTVAGVHIFPGFSLHDELGLLVRAGFTPLQALQSATLRPAEYLSLADRLGSVRQGLLADLVLLDANPLDDIANTRRIRAVVANGRYFSRDDLDGLLRGAESAASRP
jgi:membrane-bound lytic murein transglycosylase MltF/imidazolonepropionase-like amidohydrolase